MMRTLISLEPSPTEGNHNKRVFRARKWLIRFQFTAICSVLISLVIPEMRWNLTPEINIESSKKNTVALVDFLVNDRTLCECCVNFFFLF
jgi:hypothetical protein